MTPEELIAEAERLIYRALVGVRDSRADLTLEPSIQLSQTYALIAIAKRLEYINVITSPASPIVNNAWPRSRE